MNESNDGICTKNYFACLDNGDTDEYDNEYSNATTNVEYKEAPTETNGITNHNPHNHTPSQPSSLHDISTLISSLPLLVPPCSTMAQNNINGNNATHSTNDTNGMTGPPGNLTNIHNNGTIKSNTGNMNGNEQNGTARTTGHNGATGRNDNHGNTQDSHTSVK
jgi:hypothetical protein